MNEYINIFTEQYKPNKKNYIKYLFYCLFFVSLIIFIILITILIDWNKDNKNINKEIEEINDIVNIKEITNQKKISDNINNVNPPTNNKINDYLYYIDIPLIDVNFDNLIKSNNDTIGWINVPNTNINYPIVQSNDNNYYLNHSFKKDYTDAGWIFMDYRNNKDFNNKNTIIYGHSRLNKTMFGTLKNVITSNWYNNKENHVVRISTPNNNYLYQVFSTYRIKTEDYYLKTDFTNNEYKDFLKNIKKRSIYNYDCNIDENDKIITLSTCSNDNYKIVLHAKLIKIQTK